MKFGLFRYVTSFICDCSVEEATRLIVDVAECSESKLKIKKIHDSENRRIVLNAHTGNVLYRNSFMPQVKIDLIENGTNTLVNIKFELRIFVKIFIYLWLILCLMALFFVISNFNSLSFTESTVGIVCIVIMLLGGWCLSSFGLKLPSKSIAKTIFCTLTPKYENCCPKLRRW